DRSAPEEAPPVPPQRSEPDPWSGQPVADQPGPSGRPEQSGPGREPRYAGEFATAADSGWQAAEAVRGQSPPTDFTAAGLPRRTPLARLVPGSAAGSEPAPGGPAPRRDAEAVRGRLASYQ